jgi:prepilin-type N-terminal cleavage/methylation domain-containing protein
MGRTIRRKSGFTLLEVLVSLAILSATLILAYQVISGAVAAQERSEGWTKAALLGEAKVRELIDGFPEVQETQGAFPPPDDRYSWKLSVRQAMHEDAREIELEVSWEAAGDRQRILLSGVAAK